MDKNITTAPRQTRILLGVSGGIAAYKSAFLVRRLREVGCDVRVIMTDAAQQFICPLTFQALSTNPVYTTLLDPAAEAGMGHIELAKWADLFLIAPASANSIAAFAQGRADHLLSTVYLATAAPVWVAPAMNQQMWQATVTQRNIAQLSDDGVRVIQPSSGVQACGDVGLGRMPEPEYLAELVAQHFNFSAQQKPLKSVALKGKKVVITAGPTQENIDPVRYISNHSSGKMGFALASACQQAGATVTLIAGPIQLETPAHIERVNVTSAAQMLDHCLQQMQQGCDIFISAAAVADYRVAQTSPQKIKKTGDEIELKLVKNTDIVATIAKLEQKPFVFGFAAETENVEQYAQAKLRNKNLDVIACNDVSRSDIGFGADDNAMIVFSAEKYQLAAQRLQKASKHKIAEQLVEIIALNLNQQNGGG